MSTAPTTSPEAGAPAVPPARHTAGARLRLAVAAALFVGWLGWLGYTALTKSQAPVVSRAQAAAATVAVVAELTTGEDGRGVMLLRRGPGGPEVVELKEKADRPAVTAKVVEPLTGGPEAGSRIGVSNLPSCAGYSGPGTYLLLLNADPGAIVENVPAYAVVGQQRSPGADLADVGPPRIYPWTAATADDLRKQVQKLFP